MFCVFHHKSFFRFVCIFTLLTCILVACEPSFLPTPQVRITSLSPTASPTITRPIPTNTVLTAPSPAAQSSPTPIVNPYEWLTIDALKSRRYGGGVLQSVGLMEILPEFTRYRFKYRSEGLDLYGFLDIPTGDGPFPVILLMHGAVDPNEYVMLTYSTRYADAFAKAGYLTIHPNLRGYPPSEDGPNEFGVGDTMDVLNLIELVKDQSGLKGLLEKADSSRIGLWGHSMGGGVVLRVLLIDQEIKAGLLYASVNADELFNLAHFGNDGRREDKINIPDDIVESISPVDYLEEINVPVSLHHGEEDEVVPIRWTSELCRKFEQLGKQVECYLYSNQPHTFQDEGDLLFIQRSIAFFNTALLP